MTLRRFHLSGPLLLVALCLGCDQTDPLEPGVQAAAAGSGSSPTAPSGVSAVAVSESRIDVSWQDNSTNETGFEVHRSTTGPTGTFTLRTSTGAGVTTYADAGLTASTQFCYKVRAFRTTGNKTSSSDFSTAGCATTPAPPPPPPPPPPPAGPPNAPSGTDAQPAGSSAVGISWTDNSSDEDGFRIERSIDGGASWATAGTTGATSGNGGGFGDTDRTSEEQVCYRVVAFNGRGDSPPSNMDCTTPPAAPTNLTATVTDEWIELTWMDNSNVEDAYVVVIITTCLMQPEYTLDVLPANSNSFRHYAWQEWWATAGCNAVGYYVVGIADGGSSDPTSPAAP